MGCQTPKVKHEEAVRTEKESKQLVLVCEKPEAEAESKYKVSCTFFFVG